MITLVRDIKTVDPKIYELIKQGEKAGGGFGT